MMARYYELTTDEQVWVMLRVKQGLMSMQDALEYVRLQHEQAGFDPDLTIERREEQGGGRVSRGFSLFKFNRQKSIAVDEASNATLQSSNGKRPRSVFASLNGDAGKKGHGELLDLMVAQGKITSEDKQDLLAKYSTAENHRAGDTQRMILANLVKTSKISIEDAVHYSRLVGIVGSAESEARTIAEVNNAFNEKRVYNFGVYKYYRHRTSQRRILQIDFQSCQICNIQKGNLNRKFAFSQVADYESEEGLRIFIYFKEHHEYELEADTLEEKEKICRLLQLIVEQNKRHGRSRPSAQRDLKTSLSQCQKVIREGFLEKKNHGIYTTWTRRWVRIRYGELSYYKPDDENQQALNILQLSREVNIIKKLGTNGFSIATRKKVYQFRVITGGIDITEVESQRDEWYKAIRQACGERRRPSEAPSNYGDDVSVFSEGTPVKSAYSENVHKSLKSFYREIESLQTMLGINEMRDDAFKTLLRLRQIAKGLEGFVLEKDVRDQRQSSSSLTSNADSTSDFGLNSRSSDNSLTLLNNLSKDSSIDKRDEDYLVTNQSESAIKPQQSNKNSIQEPNLETVVEHNNEDCEVVQNEDSKKDIVVENGSCRISKDEELDDIPSNPPPLPPTEDAPFRERLPSRTPPPPPQPTSQLSSPKPKDPIMPKWYKSTNINYDRQRELEALYNSPHLSPYLRNKIFNSTGAMGNFIFRTPPPLPVRKSEVGTQADLPPDRTKYPSYFNTQFEAPPPIPPRKTSFSGHHSQKKRHQKQSNVQNKAKTPTPTGSKKFLWRPFKSKGGNTLPKTQATSTDTATDDRPPPLPPRYAPPPQAAPTSVSTEDDPKAQSHEKQLDHGPPAGGIATFAPPPPPPPPLPFLDATPKKNCKVKSKVKMKAFHWNKIPNRMYKQSVWKDVRDLTETIDTELLETMYADNAKEIVEPEINKNKLKSILDPKVAQNLGIFLAGFKMEVDELKYRLTILNESDGGLNQEHVNVLRRYHPSAEDVETYKQFKDCPQELEPTDQFMMQLCDISHLRTRLDILFITNEFPVQFEDLAPTINNVLLSCRTLCESNKFIGVLEYVLAVGNFINSGSSKGTAVGFRLSSLPKLSDCKARDKKFNLLKYLVQQIHKHESDLLGFVDELTPLTKVPEASVKALQAEVEVMKKDLTKVKQNALHLISVENPPERDVAFCEDVESFIEQFESKLSQLQEQTDEIKTLYDDILVRYGEPSGTESSEIFLCISEFVKAFKREVDLLMVTERGYQRRKSKKVASQQLSHKSSARDSAVESYTSLEQSDSMGSDTENTGDKTDNSESVSRRKTFSERFTEHKSFRGSRKHGDSKKFSKKIAQSRKLPENPTKEGFLEKLSNTKSPLSSQWNRRFFELTTQGYLHYCKRKHDKNFESIYLRGCPVALEDDRIIVIHTEERAYKLRAATHEEAQEWLEYMLVYTIKPVNLPRSSHSGMP